MVQLTTRQTALCFIYCTSSKRKDGVAQAGGVDIRAGWSGICWCAYTTGCARLLGDWRHLPGTECRLDCGSIPMCAGYLTELVSLCVAVSLTLMHIIIMEQVVNTCPVVGGTHRYLVTLGEIYELFIYIYNICIVEATTC